MFQSWFNNMIKVLYDGKCGLCNKEISYYKKIANNNKFKWLDIANNPKTPYDIFLIAVLENCITIYLY